MPKRPRTDISEPLVEKYTTDLSQYVNKIVVRSDIKTSLTSKETALLLFYYIPAKGVITELFRTDTYFFIPQRQDHEYAILNIPISASFNDLATYLETSNKSKFSFCTFTSRMIEVCRQFNSYLTDNDKYSFDDILDEIKNHLNIEECAICLESIIYFNVKLPCGHVFHKQCVERTYRRECPLCRKEYVVIDGNYYNIEICKFSDEESSEVEETPLPPILQHPATIQYIVNHNRVAVNLDSESDTSESEESDNGASSSSSSSSTGSSSTSSSTRHLHRI